MLVQMSTLTGFPKPGLIIMIIHPIESTQIRTITGGGGGGYTLEGGNPGVTLPLHSVWERMYGGGGNPGVSLPLWERMYAGGGVSLPLHNVWERMYTGGGKSWGVPTSA